MATLSPAKKAQSFAVSFVVWYVGHAYPTPWYVVLGRWKRNRERKKKLLFFFSLLFRLLLLLGGVSVRLRPVPRTARRPSGIPGRREAEVRKEGNEEIEEMFPLFPLPSPPPKKNPLSPFVKLTTARGKRVGN